MHTAKRTLQWPSADPKKLAYKIREAMYASRFHSDFKELHYLKDFFEIKLEPGAVMARYMGPEHGHPFQGNGKGRKDEPMPSGATPVAAGALAVMQLKEVRTLEGVVGAGIRYKEEVNEINLPAAVLGYDDKKKLWLWGQTSGWKFIDHEEDGITLTRKPVDEELLWSPGS